MHITQRFQLLGPVMAGDGIAGQLAAPAGRPYERVILWHGSLPPLAVPMHPGLGLQLSEGLLGAETFWAERCDAIASLGSLDEIAEERMAMLLPKVCEALLFLHRGGAVHGSVASDRIGLRKNGSPVLVGIGRTEGSEDGDWEALRATWAVLGHPLDRDFDPEREAAKLGSPDPWNPGKAGPQGAEEVLYQVVRFATRHRRDAAEELLDIDTTNHGLFDITAAMDTGDATGALPGKLSDPPGRASALGELLSWLYRPMQPLEGGEPCLLPAEGEGLFLPEPRDLAPWSEPAQEEGGGREETGSSTGAGVRSPPEEQADEPDGPAEAPGSGKGWSHATWLAVLLGAAGVLSWLLAG